MPDIDGVHIDFDLGAHVCIPAGHSPIEYSFVNLSTGKLEDSGIIEPPQSGYAHVSTWKKYFVPWRVIVRSNGQIYQHDISLKGERVYIDLRSALGDSIAWMRSVEVFQKKHQCKITVIQNKNYTPLFRNTHPDYTFIDTKEWEKMAVPDDCYARYICAVDAQRPERNDYQPLDFRKVSVQKCGDVILGIDSKDTAPKIDVPDLPRNEKLVCIATRASAPCKEWQNPSGWDRVIEYLKENGFRVCCIDRDRENLPIGAEDFTGEIPLIQRAAMLRQSRLFIGLPSGLSWLSFAVGTPYVLIDGMSDPSIEAPTKYVVTPPDGKCRNCWSFADQKQYRKYQLCFRAWDDCPDGKEEPKKRNSFCQYECTKSITPEMVLKKIRAAFDDTAI